jgi:hypothetical protein
MCHTMDLVNAIDERLSTIKHLGELGPAIDDNAGTYFTHAIELLSLITEHAAQAEQLMSQLAQRVLPKPRVMENRS